MLIAAARRPSCSRPGSPPGSDRAACSRVTPLQAIGGVAGALARGDPRAPGPQRARRSCSCRSGSRLLAARDRRRARQPVRRADRRGRRRALVHRPRARRAADHAAGAPTGRTDAGALAVGTARRRERAPLSGAQLAHDDRRRHRRHPRHDVRGRHGELQAHRSSRRRRISPRSIEGIEQMLDAVTSVFSALIGVSALIAAVGLVNSLSLSVLQRTRELGLLRALGFTARQLRRMILAESVQLTATAVLLGLVLGTFYGWAGAQSLLGSATECPASCFPECRGRCSPSSWGPQHCSRPSRRSSRRAARHGSLRSPPSRWSDPRLRVIRASDSRSLRAKGADARDHPSRRSARHREPPVPPLRLPASSPPVDPEARERSRASPPARSGGPSSRTARAGRTIAGLHGSTASPPRLSSKPASNRSAATPGSRPTATASRT